MNKISDGVTPFFVHTEPPKGPQLVFNQVELRDYFAAAIMQGLMASQCEVTDDPYPIYAYKIADAMIKAREVKP